VAASNSIKDVQPRKSIHSGLPKVETNSIHQLHNIVDLDRRSAKKPNASSFVLVAIDFENTHTINSSLTVEPDFQAGIAILDPKKIKSKPIGKVLRTYNFAMGTTPYAEKATSKFHFGKTTSTSLSELANHLQNIIPLDQNVVFVGHGVMNDLHALRAIGFQFPTHLPAALDTSQVADEVFGGWSGSLRDLLKLLECPYNRLHCAGNDANFTLKALLLLVAKRLEEQGKNGPMVDTLRRIGKQEIPQMPSPESKSSARLDVRAGRVKRNCKTD
jgi:hypothetical protein